MPLRYRYFKRLSAADRRYDRISRSVLWSIYSIAAQIVESDNVNRSTDKIAYYDLKKDGAVIRAEKKSDAPNWLADNVETKIISENKTSYQVQFKDEFARIQKKNVE